MRYHDTVYVLAHTHHVVNVVCFGWKSDDLDNEEVEAMYPGLHVAHVFTAPEWAVGDSDEWQAAYAFLRSQGYVLPHDFLE